MFIKHDRYEKNLNLGEIYEDYLLEYMHKRLGMTFLTYKSMLFQHYYGENTAGLEIKLDLKTKSTGNLFIETAEKCHDSEDSWRPSGIYHHSKPWQFAIGDFDRFFIFTTSTLQHLHEHSPGGEFRFRRVPTPTAQGFILPLKEAEYYSGTAISPGRNRHSQEFWDSIERLVAELATPDVAGAA